MLNHAECSLTVNDVSRFIQICSWCPGHHICYICSCLFNVLLLCEICGLQSGRRSGLGPAVQGIHLEALKVDWGPVTARLPSPNQHSRRHSGKPQLTTNPKWSECIDLLTALPKASLTSLFFWIFCFFEVVPSPAKCQPHSIPFRSVFRSKILAPYTFAAVILIHTVLWLLRLLFKHRRGGTAGGTASQTWVDFELSAWKNQEGLRFSDSIVCRGARVKACKLIVGAIKCLMFWSPGNVTASCVPIKIEKKK